MSIASIEMSLAGRHTQSKDEEATRDKNNNKPSPPHTNEIKNFHEQQQQ